MNKTEIKVFVTKSKKFRVKIKEGKNIPAYEVTVGGKNWKQGVGREYENTILRKCKVLLKIMENELKKK